MNENMKDIIDRMARAEAELAVIHDRIRRLDAKLNAEEMSDIGMERGYGSAKQYVPKSSVDVGYIRGLFGLTRSTDVTDAINKLNAERAEKEEEA
ncbi:hypothetical protein [Clostridium vitabionis]|uniref:hypothetical protein n=1 Tax=Clostridium vitabionis TaxID=2784388 RepID=UPI00188DC0C4|nr:hypothetical protein [Clostridium vitabionis]